jgi:hypothetical protein
LGQSRRNSRRWERWDDPTSIVSAVKDRVDLTTLLRSRNNGRF